MFTAFYDLAVGPPTFELASFLMRTEQECIARGEDSLEVIFIPGPAGGFRRDRLWPHSAAERRGLLDHVAAPLCRLLPRCSKVEIANSRTVKAGFGVGRRVYGLPEFVRAYRAGIRPLRAHGAVAPDPKLVTITLREAEHWPERNSRIDEWIAAAERIESDGYRVVFVRDTLQAESRVGCFATDENAARNIDDRARLYASAAVNLGVSNGPMWLALALDAPVVMLKPVTPGLHRVFGEEHLRRAGITPGQQLPGAPSHQVLAWDDDRENAIVTAFDQFMTATRGSTP